MILFSGIRDPSGWQPGRAVGQAVHALWKRGGRGEEEAGGQGLPIFNLDFVFKGEQKLPTTEDDSILLNFANINNFHDAASFNGTRADSSESSCFIW